MKTTVEIPDDLIERSRKIASREGATLKSLIEEGLRLVLRTRERRQATKFRVKPFKGDGLNAGFQDAGWEQIRDDIYRGRG